LDRVKVNGAKMRTKFLLAACFLLCFSAQFYGQTVGPTNFNGGGSGSGAIIVSSAPSSCVAGAIYINTIGGVMYFGETGNVCVTAGGASWLTSLNGLTGATQTFATGTTGTAFGIVSSGTTHTFNIPMAATSSVTAGLLSNTDYAAFAAKQAALSSNSGATHEWISSFTAPNTFGLSQPASSDLSDIATLNAATAANLASYTSYSVFGAGNAAKTWITPTANGQCLMSGASAYATTTPSFQTCPTGSGGVGTGTQYGDAFYDTTTTVASNTPAAVNGIYQVIHNVTTGAAVAPTQVLAGIPVNAQTGSTYTLAYSDRGTFIRVSGGTTFTLTLPAASTNLASNLPFIVGNFNSDTMSLTPTTPNNIDGGSGQASETLPSNWAALVYQDAGSPINWWMVKFPMIGGSGGANPALSNLAGVAINTDLLPASAGGANLGNASYPFGSLYFNGSLNYVGSSAFALSGTPGTCPVAGTNLGQLCMSSTGNRPVYSYNGAANTNVMLASDTSFAGNAAMATYSTSQVSAPPFQLGLNRGSNMAPAFASTNYTKTDWTEGTGSIVGSASSAANSFHPTTALVPVSGQTYQIDIPVTTWSSGTLTVSFGGASSRSITVAANTTYRVYLTATSDSGNLTVIGNSSGTLSMTITNIACKRAAYDATSGANVNIVIDTNSGLTVPLVVYQPVATAGWTYEEYTIAAYAITVKTANGTDTWEWGTSTYTSTLTFAATRQTFLTLVSFVTGYWDSAGLNGTVTPA